MSDPDIEEETMAADSTRTALSTRLAAGFDRFRRRWRPLTRTLDRAGHHSRIGALFDTVNGWVHQSWIVRWLTREPDPEVIVVDLTETWTVGPVLRAIDVVASMLTTPLETSVARRATARTASTIDQHPIPLASAALLGVVLWTVAQTWNGATLLWFVALALAAAAGLIGLTVERSKAVLAESTVRRWSGAILVPPDDRLE